MVVGIVNKIEFQIDRDTHTVAYAEAANNAMFSYDYPLDHSSLYSNFKAGIAENFQKLTDVIVRQMRSYVQGRKLNPKDFTIYFKWTDVHEDQFWATFERSSGAVKLGN